MSAIKIEKKIVTYAVKNEAQAPEVKPVVEPEVFKAVELDESLSRPEVLCGSTYKIKTPLSEHALYVTINDIVLNEGTEYEVKRPFEVFIQSKNMDHFMWVVALTRIMSAVFRKGGDVSFIVEELRSVFDPRGGYFKKGGKYMPSLVAELGDIIETHLKKIGMIKTEEMDAHRKHILAEKRREYDDRQAKTQQPKEDNGYPASATVCGKCHTKAVIMMDGCQVCLACSDSKCS